jgi:hypothetical protein
MKRDHTANPPMEIGNKSLIFGVSGHRDPIPSAIPQLKAQLEVVFSRFRAAYPDTPFELLSPLAEGADRLAAEVALSYQVKLLVPMPLAQAEYELDFPSSDSLGEFRKLLAAAESYWEVPPASGLSGLADEDRRARGRAERYAAMGDLIARRSHVLILLWDGRENDKMGGTAWVKKRREYWINAATDREGSPQTVSYDPTIQIVTPRAVDGGTQNRPCVRIIGNLPPG